MSEKKPTYDELLACIAEGRACVSDYFASLIDEDNAKKFPHASRRPKMTNGEAMTALLAWTYDRDNVANPAAPSTAAWAFRRRAFEAARKEVIPVLESALAALKAKQP
jgi:hypothetical protein